MRALAITAALLLAGCNQSPDGYRFESAEWERTQPNITVVAHPSLAALRAAAPAEARVEGRDLMAWSRITREGCEMHVVDPSASYQPQWIGHEVAHCVWGRWHR